MFATRMLTALQPITFRETVRTKANYNGVDKGIDKLSEETDSVMVK